MQDMPLFDWEKEMTISEYLRDVRAATYKFERLCRKIFRSF